MNLLKRIIKTVTKPMRAKVHGMVGERAVISKLNPLLFGKINHKQINNLVLVDDNNKSHQIDHIEIRENGIFCIETKNYIGWIFGNENSENWIQTLYTGEKHQFFNPLKQNRSHCYHLSQVLDKKYIINSLVVLVQNNAEKIKCKNVININDLKSYLKNFDNGVHLSSQEMDEVFNKLMNAASDMTNREHVQNIKNTKKELDQNKCPRCGGSLVFKEGKFGSFYGCSNYPKCKFTKKEK